MKILLVHNYYQQTGGEDQSFEDEALLLETHGHTVLRFTLHNKSIGGMPTSRLAVRTIWNGQVYRQLRDLMRRERPQVMHCTNIFPLISPAAYYAARAEGVPVVQSLRNYRLICANSLLLRDGKTCEKCVKRAVPWPAMIHRCYRGHFRATTVIATMLGLHRALGTWRKAVDLFVTPSEFARQKHIAGGFDPAKIVVKPNFVYPDPLAGTGSKGGAIYAGRLSPEKGIDVLLTAWLEHGLTLPLTIIGDGPMADRVRDACQRSKHIQWLGYRPPEETRELIGEAALLVTPSITYETFGRSVAEAFAKGTPVLTSDCGASADLVTPLINGDHFRRGDATDLARKINELTADPLRLSRMRDAARQEFVRKYTGSSNHAKLTAIYEQIITRARPAESNVSLANLMGAVTAICSIF